MDSFINTRTSFAVLKTAWKTTLISTPDGGCLLLLGVMIGEL